jgi:hypothetical protein
MPGGDRTGPLGQGPQTGRGLGFCSGDNTAGFTFPRRRFGLGRGFGRGFRGRGRGNWWNDPNDAYVASYPMERSAIPQPTKEQEKTYLENLIKGLEEDIKQLRNRIQDLSKEDK